MVNRTYHPRNVPIQGHAPADHPIYGVWSSMHQRCSNPKNPGFVNYGARGIRVCARWNHFENFVVDMGERPEGGFTIERMDNSRGYEPKNCKWATRSEQSINRRTFKNSSTGFRGVVQVKNRFIARMDFEHVRYQIGRFSSAEAAAQARCVFEELFFTDREMAIQTVTSEVIWCTSSTGYRGVTPHQDGGFVARATKNGVRHYLGLFSTVEEAADARSRFLAR